MIITNFTYKPIGGFTVNNGHVNEVRELGEKLQLELERIGYDISFSSFTDWGFAFYAVRTNLISIVIQMEDLDQGLFRFSLKPVKKWFQIFPLSSNGIKELFSEIQKLELNLSFK